MPSPGSATTVAVRPGCAQLGGQRLQRPGRPAVPGHEQHRTGPVLRSGVDRPVRRGEQPGEDGEDDRDSDDQGDRGEQSPAGGAHYSPQASPADTNITVSLGVVPVSVP